MLPPIYSVANVNEPERLQRYADSAKDHRWEPPVPFVSSQTQNTTAFGAACIQSFPFDAPALRSLLNRPPPPESEDCLFL